VPLTLLWLGGCANAFNLIDGVDGLAAGLGLFATITVLVSALLHGNVALALATAPLGGALAGFLRFNFNPATIFLGDCGSLTVGLLLGCFGALWVEKSATMLGMTAPLMALAVPLLDTALAIARRFLRKEKIWEADRGHIHHRLLDRGLTPRKAVLVLYGVAALGAVLSIAQSSLANGYAGVVVILFCAAAWMGIQHLGYVEFGVAGRMFIDGAFRRRLKAQILLQALEESLGRATTPDECWQAIAGAGREFGCHGVSMRLSGRAFGNGGGNGGEPGTFLVRIPLDGGDYVELEREVDGAPRPEAVGAFASLISKKLLAKLPELRKRKPAEPLRARAAAT